VSQSQITTLVTTCRTFLIKCVGSEMSPANHVILKMQEMGPMLLESLFEKS